MRSVQYECPLELKPSGTPRSTNQYFSRFPGERTCPPPGRPHPPRADSVTPRVPTLTVTHFVVRKVQARGGQTVS
eukprot:2939937-Prymnesium_polylepis.1